MQPALWESWYVRWVQKEKKVLCVSVAVWMHPWTKLWCVMPLSPKNVCVSERRYSGKAHLFSLLSPRFSPIFYPTCHLHPSWPAALHIGFLMFLANRLHCTSKGMIYALKWMNEEPYLSCFRIFHSLLRAVIGCAALFWPRRIHPVWTATHDNYYDFLAATNRQGLLIYNCGHCKTYYRL